MKTKLGLTKAEEPRSDCYVHVPKLRFYEEKNVPLDVQMAQQMDFDRIEPEMMNETDIPLLEQSNIPATKFFQTDFEVNQLLTDFEERRVSAKFNGEDGFFYLSGPESELEAAKSELQNFIKVKHQEKFTLTKILDKSLLSAIRQIGPENLNQLFDCTLIPVNGKVTYHDSLKIINHHLMDLCMNEYEGQSKIYGYEAQSNDKQSIQIGNTSCVLFENSQN